MSSSYEPIKQIMLRLSCRVTQSCTPAHLVSVHLCILVQFCNSAQSWPSPGHHILLSSTSHLSIPHATSNHVFLATHNLVKPVFITNTNKSINPSPSLLPHPHTPLPNGPTQIKVRVGGLSNLGWTIQANHYTHNKTDLYAVCEEEASPSRGTFVTLPRPRHLG